MTFRIPYISKNDQTPEEIAESQKHLQQIHDQWKREQERMKQAREQQLALQAREAEAEIAAALAASNVQPPISDTIDISKPTKWINGFLVPNIPEPTSPQVSKIQAMTDASNRFRQNVRR